MRKEDVSVVGKTATWVRFLIETDPCSVLGKGSFECCNFLIYEFLVYCFDWSFTMYCSPILHHQLGVLSCGIHFYN